jgi:hypothetical protein
MSVEIARRALLWCGLINYVMLLVWWLLLMFTREWLHRLWSRWFQLSAEQFDAMNFIGLMLYKTAIWMFFLIPAIVLYFVA